MRLTTDFGGKIMAKWERINNKHSHSHLSYSHSDPIPISSSNLIPIPMGIPREGWESRISYSHAHFYLEACNTVEHDLV